MAGFTGTPGAKDADWPPASRNDALDDPPDYLGVWLRTTYNGLTGFAFATVTVTGRASSASNRTWPDEGASARSARDRRRGRGDGVLVIVMTALLLLPMVTFAAFGVDLASWYARISHLQTLGRRRRAGRHRVDAQPDEGAAVATDTLARNHIVDGVDDVTVTITEGATPTSLRVEVTDHTPTRFFSALGVGDQALQPLRGGRVLPAAPVGEPAELLRRRRDQDRHPGHDHDHRGLAGAVQQHDPPAGGPVRLQRRHHAAPRASAVGRSATTYSATGFSGTTQCTWTTVTADDLAGADDAGARPTCPCNRLQTPDRLARPVERRRPRRAPDLHGRQPPHVSAAPATGSAPGRSRAPSRPTRHPGADQRALQRHRRAPRRAAGTWCSVPLFLPARPARRPAVPVARRRSPPRSPSHPNPIPADRSPGFWAQVEGPARSPPTATPSRPGARRRSAAPRRRASSGATRATGT